MEWGLNVVEGIREITAIHSRLYGGILKPHLPPFLQKGYTPHLTVGRLDTTDAYLQAVNAVASLADEFETTVTKVSVEIIADNEDSIIEMELDLGKQGSSWRI
ncbi:2'-5' RNA ligase family protein [Paenibacillus silviterrae]|uniref:2'-5' RNA ligase family protein n=1 Tax=Paenibacillus silviterrae TaxID=3242194 RepID=UPI00254322D0|nr:2'-5' RNA ligase family protein [Paenibacillus chinjuensis]